MELGTSSFHLKRVILPIIRRNFDFYSEEVYDKIMKSEAVSALVENGSLFLTKPSSLFDDFDPTNKISDIKNINGVIRGFDKHRVVADLIILNKGSKHLNHVVGCCERFCERIGEYKDGLFIIADGKLICFDLVYTEKFEEIQKKYTAQICLKYPQTKKGN